MKKTSVIKIALLSALAFNLCTSAIAQTHYTTAVTDIRLTGTSTLHDWEMKAVNGKSEASFVVADGVITSLVQLSFTLPAKNLKSDHTVMDKNTYKALRTSENPNLSFVLTSAKVTATSGNNYQLNCTGNLTIAGTTNETNLLATGIYNPVDKSFTITGVKKMKMTDYNVKPPKVMLGTIKTGNDISISYHIKFTS